MRIQAEIVKYCPDDLHFDQDEDSEWFDGIILKILTPKDLKGYKITIFLDEYMIDENPWKQVGKIIEFEYDNSISDFDRYDIFTSSLKNILFRS